MERVDYHLERLLPSVQLLAELKLFTHEELRAFMHKRRVCETSLISRNVSPASYLDYVRMEESFERLVQLKLSRSPRDGNREDVITLKDRSKLRRFQEKHLISIWQRFITKLGRHDPQIFTRYLAWLQQRGMRRVYSEIAAQALSLHSSYTPLWVQVAEWELNGNMDASAARLTLLRGIRLNTVVQNDAKRNAVIAKREGRRKKRQRRLREGRENGDGDDAEQVSSSDDESTPTQAEARKSYTPTPLLLPEALPAAHLQLVDLWLAYFRMELVFLERLRRRWAVLGVTGAATVKEVNEKGAMAEEGSDNEDNEEGDNEGATEPARPIAKPKASAAEEEADSKTRAAIDNSAPTQILSGALPLRIVSSALDLPSSAPAANAASSPSLPPNTRFLFLAEALRLVASFPFANANADVDDGSQLRNDLVQSIRESTMAAMVQSDAGAGLLSLAYYQARLSLMAAILEDRLNTSTSTIDPEENAKAQRERLENASRLVRGQEGAVSLAQGAPLDESILGPGSQALASAEDHQSASSPAQAHVMAGATRAVNYLIRSLSRVVEMYLFELNSLVDEDQWHVEVRVQFAQFAKSLLEELTGAKAASTSITVLKVVLMFWRQLSWRKENGEDSDGDSGDADEDEKVIGKIVPVQDPLAPYLAAIFERTVSSLSKPSETSTTLKLIFAYQTALHRGADTEDWNQVVKDAQESAASFKGSESIATLLQLIRRRGL